MAKAKPWHFNDFFARRMRELGLTQTEVAKALGVNSTYVNIMTRPENSGRMFSMDLWPKLADVLQIDFRSLSALLLQEHYPNFARRALSEQHWPLLESPFANTLLPGPEAGANSVDDELIEKFRRLGPNERLIFAELFDSIEAKRQKGLRVSKQELELLTA